MPARRVVRNVPVLRGRVPKREMVMATIHGQEDKEAVVQAHDEGKGREKRGSVESESAKWIVPEQESADRRKYFSATGESLDDNSSARPMLG